jgi:hypothetical protein
MRQFLSKKRLAIYSKSLILGVAQGLFRIFACFKNRERAKVLNDGFLCTESADEFYELRIYSFLKLLFYLFF